MLVPPRARFRLSHTAPVPRTAFGLLRANTRCRPVTGPLAVRCSAGFVGHGWPFNALRQHYSSCAFARACGTMQPLHRFAFCAVDGCAALASSACHGYSGMLVLQFIAIHLLPRVPVVYVCGFLPLRSATFVTWFSAYALFFI